MKKITITNAYTWYNKGDAGILLGIVEALKKVFGENELEINILSFSPQIDKEKYCEDSCIKGVYSNVLNPHPYKHTKLGKIWAILKLFVRMIYLLIFQKFALNQIIKNNKEYEVLSQSDIIVVCGGGFLGGKKFDSLMHIFQIYVNTIFKKPVIVMGTSIEPVKNRIIKNITEFVLKKVDHVFARETITYSYLNTFIENEKISLIPDMAFMLDDKSFNNDLIKELKDKNNIIYGITVRNWKFPNLKENSESLMRNYMDSITQMMTKFINEENAYFVFVPQVTVDTGNDTIVAKKIKEMLNIDIRDHFIILENDISPLEIKGLISNFSFFIGTRMHSNIFATSMKIPTVAIAYEKKTNGIMETLDMSEYIVEIDDITKESLIQKILLLKQNEETVKKSLNNKIPMLKLTIINEINRVMKKI